LPRLAEIFGVSLSWVKRVLRGRRQTGSTEVLPLAGGKRPKLTEKQQEQVRHYVLADTDATLRAGQSWLQATETIPVSLSTLSRLLTRLDLPRPKDTPRYRAGNGGEAGKTRPLAGASGRDRSGPSGLG
jgi:transposase